MNRMLHLINVFATMLCTWHKVSAQATFVHECFGLRGLSETCCCWSGTDVGLMVMMVVPEMTHFSVSGSRVRREGSVATQCGNEDIMRSTPTKRMWIRPPLVTTALAMPSSIDENPLIVTSSSPRGVLSTLKRQAVLMKIFVEGDYFVLGSEY
jgi:hypothetical protein